MGYGELGELHALSAEIARDGFNGTDVNRIANFNYRLRVLMNRHASTAEQVADLLNIDAARVRCWRTNPSSRGYQSMTETEFSTFETALNACLEAKVK